MSSGHPKASESNHADELLGKILARSIEPSAVTRAIADLVDNGTPVPPELEAAALELYISDDATRIDLKRRLVVVLRQLGRAVDNALLTEVRDSLIAEEYNTDFQTLLEEFGKNVRHADMEPAFAHILSKVRPYTMTSIERLYALWSSIGYLCESSVPGDIVECGVWRGGSMMTAALELVRRKALERRLWLFDTFAGLPKPDPRLDVDALGNRAVDGWDARTLPDGVTYWAFADEQDVRRNLQMTGYPERLLHFVKGLVEETIPRTAPEQIALLRIDTDWYSSYRHILNALYERVALGGIIIFDDYGHFNGARQAIDEFRKERRISSPLMRVDYSCRVMLKLAN